MNKEFFVAQEHTALHLGSGDLPVLGTPAVIAFLENVSKEEVQSLLQEGQTTVGGQVSVEHLRPTSIGEKVVATATLTKQEGRKLTFILSASDSRGEIVRGTHVRFIVEKEQFMKKF